MYDLDTEISAITANLEAEHDKVLSAGESSSMYASQRQLFGLNGLLRKGMKNTDNTTRYAVLDVIAGKAVKHKLGISPIKSSKNLSGPMTSVLINLLLEPESKPWRLSEYGYWLISAAEARVEIQLGQLEFEQMSNMQQAHP
jgi:hypothetical protein